MLRRCKRSALEIESLLCQQPFGHLSLPLLIDRAVQEIGADLLGALLNLLQKGDQALLAGAESLVEHIRSHAALIVVQKRVIGCVSCRIRTSQLDH